MRLASVAESVNTAAGGQKLTEAQQRVILVLKEAIGPVSVKEVLQVAKTHAKGRLVSCLEGGYHLDALAESVQAHLQSLLETSK